MVACTRVPGLMPEEETTLALVSAIPAVAADSKADKTWQEAWTAYNIGQYKKTLRLLQPLASDGDARSQVLLGRCYENGLGVPQDLATAFKWYMLAAEQNDAEAQTLVAYMLRSGAGVPRDTNGYLQWMQRAAQSGYAEAQFNMALICADGELVTKDPEQSFDWAKRAAEQGNGQAQRFLGACYEVGFGVPQDATESALWYAKAAQQGLERDGSIFSHIRQYPKP